MVVLFGAGQEVGIVLVAGGFEVNTRGAATSVRADFNGYAGVGGRASVRGSPGIAGCNNSGDGALGGTGGRRMQGLGSKAAGASASRLCGSSSSAGTV